MPAEPDEGVVERLLGAVDGAVWVHWDRPHKRLYVGRHDDANGPAVHTWDVPTGQRADNPWPVLAELVVLNGYGAAFHVAVTERIRQGY